MVRYGHKHGYPHLEHVTLPRIGVTQTILEELSEGKDGLVAETSHRAVADGMHYSTIVANVLLVQVHVVRHDVTPVDITAWQREDS